MKKNYGFSLVEVLMVMSIIAIVATMGFSISSRNMEKAYNQYWYTGYKGLLDATFDAGLNGKLSTYDDYINHVNSLVSTGAVVQDTSAKVVKARNGIKYSFQNLNSQKSCWQIEMEIPTPKQKKLLKNKTTFVFKKSTSLIYPANLTESSATTDLNLQNRVDLLPFQINDSLPSGSGSHDKTYYSYRDAYCITHNNSSIQTSNEAEKLICPTSPAITPIDGIMIPVNPKSIY